MRSTTDPHAGHPILTSGAPLDRARVAVILVHGRGGSADDILSIASELDARDLACLAPQAADNTWYPYSFLAPIPQNQPHLDSALRLLQTIVARIEAQGLASDRIALLGFSQGACLSLEFAARAARRYAGIIGFSGGVIGPPGTPRDYRGSFDGTPVFLGCSDVDPHIPLARVHETAAVFRALGAAVDERIYPGMGHTISRDEIEAAAKILSAVAPR
jgi:predicted esterase